MISISKKPIRWFAAMVVFMQLAGCGQRELISDLNEKQAREVVVALSTISISAERERASGSGGKYSISVAEQNYSKALQFLQDQELPKHDTNPCETFLGARSFIPDSPETAQLRRDCALAAEVEKILSGLQGVTDVRAIVRSSVKGKDPVRAAVLIRSNSLAAKSLSDVDSIKQLVVQVVPDLLADFVTIKFARSGARETPSAIGTTEEDDGRVDIASLKKLWPGVFDFNVPVTEHSGARQRMMLIILGVFVAATLIGVFFGLLISPGRRAKLKRERKGSIAQESFFNDRRNGADEAAEVQRRGRTGSGNLVP